MAGHLIASQPQIEQISDEILLTIFELLSLDDILRVCCVCRRFNRLANDQSLHRNVDFGSSGENLFVSSKILQSYVTRHASWIESFTLLDCYWISAHKIMSILKPCQNLHELNIIGCEKLSLSKLALLAERNPHLTKLGISFPSKIDEVGVTGELANTTLLYKQLCDFFGRLSSLKLRIKKLDNFKTLISLFPRNMKLLELSLEFTGPKPTSIIHDGSDNHIHIKSNIPFSMNYNGKLQAHRNMSLYFNVIFMDFATKVALNATETEELECLLVPGSFNVVAMNQIAVSPKTPPISMLDLSSTHLTPEKMNWLGHLTNLTHLNLQHVEGFKTNLMKAVATNCRNLTLLNLNNCRDWVDEDLCALKALCSSCVKLKHLNVGRICLHSFPFHCHDEIYKIIAQFQQLQSLSVAPCCLVKVMSVDGAGSVGHLSKTVGKQSNLVEKIGVKKSDDEAVLTMSTTNSSLLPVSKPPGYITRHAAQQKEFEAKVIQNGSGIDDLVQGLTEIENLELTAVGYSSVFSVSMEMNMDSFVCSVTRNLLDASFLPLKNCTKLRSLTLAGLHGLGSFNSLIEITKSCENLEQLSLANIGLPGNALALAALPDALKNCHRLKRLRIDQPHFNRTDKVLLSLQHCKHIEGILIACKNGKIPKDHQLYFDLFEACKRLSVFQLFSGAPGVFCKVLSRELTTRYRKERPPLSVSVLHFNQSLTEDGLQNIPFAHLKTLTCFQSKIAL